MNLNLILLFALCICILETTAQKGSRKRGKKDTDDASGDEPKTDSDDQTVGDGEITTEGSTNVVNTTDDYYLTDKVGEPTTEGATFDTATEGTTDDDTATKVSTNVVKTTDDYYLTDKVGEPTTEGATFDTATEGSDDEPTTEGNTNVVGSTDDYYMTDKVGEPTTEGATFDTATERTTDDEGDTDFSTPLKDDKKPGGKSDLAESKKKAAELAAKIEAIHKDDPRDPLQLAKRVLQKSFAIFNKEPTVKVTDLLKSSTEYASRSLFSLLKMFEFLDYDNSYTISSDEFTKLFMAPVAHPDKLIDMMFRTQDYDGDGVISKYEYLQSEILNLGINYNLFDMWRVVNQGQAEIDVNEDGVVDGAEYTNYVVYQINKAIVIQRQGEKKARAP